MSPGTQTHGPLHPLTEQNLLLFLLQVLILLGCARGLGLLFARFGQPSITAEILVGIFFGPTVLGRLWPGLQQAIFPADAIQQTMLEAVAWLGILFFLLDTGLETDFATAWRQRHSALVISLSDIFIPMLIAFVPCMLLPAKYLVDPQQRVLFSVFVATIMTISALPVTARVLQELDLYRTDTGLLIICALTINDVAGWLIFAVLLSFAAEGTLDATTIPVILAATFLFAFVSLTAGKRMTNAVLERFRKWELPEPGSSLTFLCLLGLLGGIITTWIGIHALFGFFIAGIMVGESRALTENTRHVMHQMVRAVLVPLFFATIGLKVDFVSNFNLLLVLLLLVVGIGGRFLGAWIGAVWTRQPNVNRQLIGAAHTPGGEMQIVIGMLAMEYGVITEAVYVAIIFGAVTSSIALGPWMRRALQRLRVRSVRECFPADALHLDLRARDRAGALRELCEVAALHTPGLDLAAAHAAVAAREEAMGTSLGHGVAVPHARMDELKSAVVVSARSKEGIDWNAPDGQPAKLLFLVLTPTHDAEMQIHILAKVAAALRTEEQRKALFEAPTPEVFYRALCRGLEDAAKKT
ncbi:MAG: PTS system fructose-specific EIIABC component [Verrucomicrobia bacterium ADurb.Bin345]|nr:MAG: PTS system fructose-specific EIIABC component [Verrucomicrobia bacterium ADurb.Bin345]